MADGALGNIRVGGSDPEYVDAVELKLKCRELADQMLATMPNDALKGVVALPTSFVEQGNLTPGEFLAFTAYNSMLVWPSRNLGRLLAELSKTSISATRLFDILDAQEEENCPDPKRPSMEGDIVFQNVNFGYNQSEGGVLHDVSFTIKAGTTFGVLGATGSGKSTLMYLLDRLYELPRENGSITIGGVDIRDIDLSYLRKNIGIVLQEPFLFSKSFRESIADGASRADLETVRHFARLAVIDDAIENFAQGYDTPIGERGVTISGGDVTLPVFRTSCAAVFSFFHPFCRRRSSSATR